MTTTCGCIVLTPAATEPCGAGAARGSVSCSSPGPPSCIHVYSNDNTGRKNRAQARHLALSWTPLGHIFTLWPQQQGPEACRGGGRCFQKLPRAGGLAALSPHGGIPKATCARSPFSPVFTHGSPWGLLPWDRQASGSRSAERRGPAKARWPGPTPKRSHNSWSPGSTLWVPLSQRARAGPTEVARLIRGRSWGWDTTSAPLWPVRQRWVGEPRL